jgi:hypothetical protein
MQRRRLASVSAVVILLASAVHAAGLGSARVLSQSQDGLHLVLDIDVPPPLRSEIRISGQGFTRLQFPGWRGEGSPGAPELAVRSELVALPPGGTAAVQVLSSTVEDYGTLRLAPRAMAGVERLPHGPGNGTAEILVEDLRYDPRAYAADGPSETMVRLGAPGMLRHAAVVPLEIRPVLYDPATGRTRVVRHLRVGVDLVAGRTSAGVPVQGTSSIDWERIYAGSLLNGAQASRWRRAPERVALQAGALKSGLLRPGLLGEEQWKLHVHVTGPQRVLGATLLGAGFPAATPTWQLRLALQRFDAGHPLAPRVIEIPIQVVDVDGDGSFDSEDSFLFYGEHPRDDTTSEDTLARYSQENVYWLSIATAGQPVRMRVRPRRPAALPGPATFRQELVYEQDLIVDRFVFGSNLNPGDDKELYYWMGGGNLQRVAVTVPVPARASGESLRVCVDTQEDQYRRPFTLYVRTGGRDSVQLAVQHGTHPPDYQAPPLLATCGTAPGALLDPGPATVILRTTSPDSFLPYLDRVRVEYRSAYAAEGNRLRCTNGGAAGTLAFPISGFTDATLRAFDITDAKQPAAFDLTGALVAGTLTLTDSLAPSDARVYLALADASIPSLATADVERDHPDDILAELGTSPLGTYDALVVANDAFADEPALAAWVAHRSSQGHRLRVIRTSDVYDAFRGGLHHYEAIHRLCQLAFANWGIEFVVLVGDGSEDPAHIVPTSGIDYVPARVRYFKVPSSSGGAALYRNDLDDKYYAQVAGTASDFYPDLLLGRLPVGNRAELQAVLQKTELYDTPQSGDDSAWRKRVLMLSDDEWVKRNVPGVSQLAHKRSCYEVGFQTSVERASDTVDGAFPGDLHAVRFLLRDLSNRLYPRVPEHRPVPLDSTCYYAGDSVTEGQAHATGDYELGFYLGTVGRALADSVGNGTLFFALQSHADRAVVADEFIMDTRGDPFAPDFRNYGKPFVFFGFGCHLNEFGPAGEDDLTPPGDCLGEKLVLVPSRGAVASYASTGFEYLDQNNEFHEQMWDVIFNKRYTLGLGGRPLDASQQPANWLLSSLLTLGELRYGDPDLITRYCLLGDPLLQLDAGVPRVAVDSIENGFLQAGNRLVVRDPTQPLGLQITLRDEQGIDSLWVVRRHPDGSVTPIDSVTVTASIDTAAAIQVKRSFTVAFRLRADECNFDIVVGGRDVAGRRTEFVGRMMFDTALLANGVTIHSGDRVDPRTAFQFVIHGCAPILPPLPLAVEVDGALLPPDQISLHADSVYANWSADFTLQLATGDHTLRFLYAGLDVGTQVVTVGGFGMSEILAFPNPMRKTNDVVRIYFHLGEPIAGGSLRVLTPSGRKVLQLNLADPGVVQSDIEVPPGAIGSGTGQDPWHWNYVEVFRDGRDLVGDLLANGVYLYELRIRGVAGGEQRHRDKLVIMR